MIKPNKEKQKPYKFEDLFVVRKKVSPPVDETPPPTPVPAPTPQVMPGPTPAPTPVPETTEAKKNPVMDALSKIYSGALSFSQGVSQYVPVKRLADTAFGQNKDLTPEQVAQKYSLESALGHEPTTTEKFLQGMGSALPMIVGGALAKGVAGMMGVGGTLGATGAYGAGGSPKDVATGAVGGAAFVPGMGAASMATNKVLSKVAPSLLGSGLKGFAGGVASDVAGGLGGTLASGLATAPITGQMPSAGEYAQSALMNTLLNRTMHAATNYAKPAPPTAPTAPMTPIMPNKVTTGQYTKPGATKLQPVPTVPPVEPKLNIPEPIKLMPALDNLHENISVLEEPNSPTTKLDFAKLKSLFLEDLKANSDSTKAKQLEKLSEDKSKSLLLNNLQGKAKAEDLDNLHLDKLKSLLLENLNKDIKPPATKIQEAALKPTEPKTQSYFPSGKDAKGEIPKMEMPKTEIAPPKEIPKMENPNANLENLQRNLDNLRQTKAPPKIPPNSSREGVKVESDNQGKVNIPPSESVPKNTQEKASLSDAKKVAELKKKFSELKKEAVVIKNQAAELKKVTSGMAKGPEKTLNVKKYKELTSRATELKTQAKAIQDEMKALKSTPSIPVMEAPKPPSTEEAVSQIEQLLNSKKKIETQGDSEVPEPFKSGAKSPEGFTAKTLKNEKGAINFKRKPTQFSYTYENPKLEAKYVKNYGVKNDTTWQRMKSTLTDIAHGFSRPIKELPVGEKYAEAIDTLVNIPRLKNMASDESIRDLKQIGETIVESADDINTFSRKIQLDDAAEDIKRGLKPANEFTPAENAKELVRIQKHINPKIEAAVKKHKEVFDNTKKDYIDAAKDLGIAEDGLEDKLNREYYFRHMILDEEGKPVHGSGKSVNTTKVSNNRSFLRNREGMGNTNTNYLEASFEVLWKMKHDTLMMKALKRIEPYSIAEQVRNEAKIQKLSDWKDAIPDGYRPWQPKDETFLYLTNSIPSEILRTLMSKNLRQQGKTLSDIPKVLATGRKGGEWVLPNELADALDRIGKQTELGRDWFTKGYLKAMSKTKRWWLYGNPYNFLKYNIRNQSGDLDLLLRNRPSMAKNISELWNEAYKDFGNAYHNGIFSKDMKAFYDMGGWQILSDMHEITEVNKIKFFEKFNKPSITDVPRKIKDGYLKLVGDATQLREMLFRYMMFKDVLKELRASPTGLPKEYMSSKREFIQGLKTIERRAFKLSSDALLDYGYVSEYGKVLARWVMPFYRFQEANFRSTVDWVDNVWKDAKTQKQLGNAFGKFTDATAIRVGRMATRMFLFTTLVGIYNFFQGKNLKDVPDDVKSRLYITLYRDKDDVVRYFSRLGALTDVMEWFGLGRGPAEFTAMLNGQLSWDEYLSLERLTDLAKESPKEAINKLWGMLGPHLKLLAELPSGKKMFPDVFNPINIKDRYEYLAESLAVGNIYKLFAGKPNRGVFDTLFDPRNLVTYKADPKKVAYDSVNSMVRKYLEKIGKATKGYSENVRSEALYNYKQALKLKDKKAADKYLKKYSELGGTAKGLQESLKNLHPLAGLSPADRVRFLKELRPAEREKVDLAIEHYKSLISAVGEKKNEGE